MTIQSKSCPHCLVALLKLVLRSDIAVHGDAVGSGHCRAKPDINWYRNDIVRVISHRLVVLLELVLRKDVAVQRDAVLVDRRLAPSAGLVAKLRIRWDGRVQARDLRGV